MIDPLGRPPILPSLGRGAIALAASCALTWLSLQLVVELNRDPQPVEHAHATTDPIAVPVAPRPEPPSPEAPVQAGEPADASATANAPTSVEPPSPRPPAIAGVAPTAGPGSLALPMATSELPSVSTLPSARLDDALASAEPDTPARVTHRPAPTYPAIAQRRGIEGFVTLRLRIDARGRVEDAVVVESQPPSVFDQTALRTVRAYRFAPARSGGEAVPTTLQQTIRFELESE